MKGLAVDLPCHELRECSGYLKDRITFHPGVLEESLSDWLLFESARRIPNVHYRAFSRNEEGATSGADWEWWFLLPFGNLKMRVQAKRLRPGKPPLSGFRYKNRRGRQIEMLIRSAKSDGFLPVYLV